MERFQSIRNADQFIQWAQEGQILNIITSDYVEYGGLCDKIIAYYRKKLAIRKQAAP